MSSQGSRSRSSSRAGGSRSPSPKRESRSNKLFVTNLDANGDLRKMEQQLRELFSKYGQIANCVVKRSHNNEYCYAFIDYKDGEDATQAIKKLNGIALGQKNMKVESQDNSRRRKANGGECFKCGKPGHFARQCRSQRIDDRDRRRSRSRSKDRKKKKSHRHRSESSQSRHHRKKDKKKHKSKKSKKSSKKKHYSSDSGSSD